MLEVERFTVHFSSATLRPVSTTVASSTTPTRLGAEPGEAAPFAKGSAVTGVLHRSIEAVHSYPVSGEQSVLTRRILTALSDHARRSFALYTPDERLRIRETRGTPLFRIQVTELRTMIEQSSKDTKRVYDAVETIFKWVLRWNLVATDNGQSQVVESFTSRVISSYGTRSKTSPGTISFEFPYPVLMLMLEPRPYTQIQLRVINALGSSYAIALYDIAIKYMGTRASATPVLPLGEWVAMIAGIGRYENFKDFKRYVLKPAMEWLEKVESCPFTVELVEFTGPKNRVTDLQFKLHAKQQVALDLDLGPLSWSPVVTELLTKSYGLTASMIALWARTCTEAEVLEAIERDRLLETSGPSLVRFQMDRASYLQGLIRNVQTGQPRKKEPDLDAIDQAPQALQLARTEAQTLKVNFYAQREHLVQDRLPRIGTARLGQLRSMFLERLENGTVQADLPPGAHEKGWGPRNRPLHEAFARWVIEREPELCKELLPKPEENDFGVWLVVRQSQAQGHGESV